MITQKKADISGMKFIVYMTYAFMILLSAGGFVGTISSISGSMNEIPPGIEERVVRERILSSPDCLAYTDRTGRTYDMIDMARFNNETLSGCIDLESYNYEYRFIVDDIGEEERAYTAEWFGDFFEVSLRSPTLVYDRGNISLSHMLIERQPKTVSRR